MNLERAEREFQKRQLGLFLRDQGVDLAMSHNEQWSARATEIFLLNRDALRGREITADNIRRLTRAEKLLAPSTPNAWGGLCSRLAKAGYLQDTGRTIRSTRKKAHARKLTIWLVL